MGNEKRDGGENDKGSSEYPRSLLAGVEIPRSVHVAVLHFLRERSVRFLDDIFCKQCLRFLEEETDHQTGCH